MSSRFGAIAAGTDGGDYTHRQKVAFHYKESVRDKFRLKLLFGLDGLLIVLVSVKLFAELVSRFGGLPLADWRLFGPLIALPSAHCWELWWLLGSALAIPCGLLSMARNESRLIRWSYYGTFLGKVMPIMVGMGLHGPEMLSFIRDPKGAQVVVNFAGKIPLSVLWFTFFIVAIQVHVLEMYVALELYRLWRPPAPTAKKTN